MEESYQIFTDVTADLDVSLFRPGEVEFIPMHVTLGANQFLHFCDYREMSVSEFYSRLKNGEPAQTVQINISEYCCFFEPFLQSGIDILYFCFSSGLSGTNQSANIAASLLKEKYPERKIVVIDTLCASIGLGTLVYTAAEKKREGMSFEELCTWADENKLNVCHLFAVDDLKHLHRGGRLSAATAIAGSMLQIKPILSLDAAGKLYITAKARGAVRANEIMIENMLSLGIGLNNQTVLIGHANAPENAKTLSDMIFQTGAVKETKICNIGPVIGSHVGQGMTSLSFFGKRRSSIFS